MPDCHIPWRSMSLVAKRARERKLVIGALLSIIFFLYFVVSFRGDTQKSTNAKMSFCNKHLCGKTFSDDLLPYLDKFHLRDYHIRNAKMSLTSLDDAVIVTYASSNHFGESRFLLRNIRSQLKNKIIFFDLGLTESELKELNSVCDLEVRKLEYVLYPEHVKNLQNYAFKDIIVSEMLLEFDAFLSLDSSLRVWNVKNLVTFWRDFNRGKYTDYLINAPNGGTFLKYTHPGMYEYFPLTEMEKLEETYDSTLIVRKSQFSMRIQKWLLLCALTEDCISPPHATTTCTGIKEYFGSHPAWLFGICHRFDQSARNIVLRVLSGREQIHKGVFNTFLHTERLQVSDETLYLPCL